MGRQGTIGEMRVVGFIVQSAQAAFVFGMMVHYAINNFGAPWGSAILVGLLFLGTVLAIRLLANLITRSQP
jgi:hypothetical protein